MRLRFSPAVLGAAVPALLPVILQDEGWELQLLAQAAAVPVAISDELPAEELLPKSAALRGLITDIAGRLLDEAEMAMLQLAVLAPVMSLLLLKGRLPQPLLAITAMPAEAAAAMLGRYAAAGSSAAIENQA